jgi:hypothetical protein
LNSGDFLGKVAFATTTHVSPGKSTAVTYSTVLSLLLATPFAEKILPLAGKLLPHLHQIASLLEDFRSQPVTPAATRDFELRLHDLLRQVGLDLTDYTFNHLEEQPFPQRLEHDGERYRLRQSTPNTIATFFGPIVLRRHLYEDLEPGNPCLFPLEKRLGIVAGAATPALAERASWWLAQHPQGTTLNALQRDHGVRPAVGTLRAITSAFAEALEVQRQPSQVEQILGWLKLANASSGRCRPSLVVGRDGIHLPMRGRDPYKEGTTATLSVYDRRGRRLGTVYLGRMPEAGQHTLSQQLTDLLVGVLAAWQGTLPRLAYVTDGGYHPALYRRVLSGLTHPRTGELLVWVLVVDYYHAASYVQTLGESLFGATKAGRAWSRRMRRRLKEKDGLKRVLQAATYHAQTQRLQGSRAEDYDKAYRYLRRNGPYLRYANNRRLQLPIGSGVTEAGCKTLFTQRLKQSGMRWEVASGQVVVTLRAVLLSGVWESAVRRMLDSQVFPWPGVEACASSPKAEKAA